MEDISENNPDLEEMRERGWAWIQRSTNTGKHGAPYTSDAYATASVERLYGEGEEEESNIRDQDLLIVTWEEQ